LNIAMIISGRRSAIVQRIEAGLSLLLCAAMLWTVAGGPILMTASGDSTAKVLMVLIVAGVLISMGAKLYRSVRPTPGGQVQVSR
jgi:membrane protein implicated in regulation of membrane protease activity